MSSDAHFVYFYGRTDETFGDVVDVYDNRSESSRPSLSRTPPRTIGLISAASQTNGDLYVTGTTTGTTLLKLYRCGLGSLPANCVVVAGRGEGVHDVSVREDLPGGTRYAYADSAGAFIEVGAATRKLLHAGAIQVRLTWQGDAVTSARPDNAQPGIWRFDLDANANTIKQTKLLDNVLDGAPAFSWPWSP